MLSAVYRRRKTNREENLTKYAGSINANVKKEEKIERVNDKKGCEHAEKARQIIKYEKRDLFQSVSVRF